MNPISTIRLVSNIALVGVILAFWIARAVQGNQTSDMWVWIIGGTALAGALAQLAFSILKPSAINAAWDEQALAANRAALGFGYITTLGAFVILMLLTTRDIISPTTAFYLLGTPLAVAPAAWMATAQLMGRA